MRRPGRARGAVVVALAALAALVARGGVTATRAAPPLPTAPAAAIGFDHPTHEGRVVVSGRDPQPCTACHTIDGAGALLGRPGHAACFGACHGAMPAAGGTPAADQVRVCEACHAPAAVGTRRATVAYPPYAFDPDFGLTMSHAAHAAAPCTTCHRVPGPAGTPRLAPPGRTRPHARCASCHDGRGPAGPMIACLTCHPPAFGANAVPRLVRGPLAVGAAYDHGRHAARGGAAAPRAALGCATCHAGLAATAGVDLPTPTMATCASAGCHDGSAAFATTVSCTRCHQAAPPVATPVARPDAPFDHAVHATRFAIDACATCHAIDPKGEPRSTGHGACTACHADDFGAARPRTCGACHASTEPWRALIADRRPPATSDFGAHLDHGRHRAVACERCHVLTTTTRELRPPRGHAACAGSGCHAPRDGATAGAAPPLDACAACHDLGLERRHDVARRDAPWSVRARFRHAVHARDRADAPLPCTTCHAAATATDAAATMAPPAKATCAPCHDGKLAFKMTGHGCARCHGE